MTTETTLAVILAFCLGVTVIIAARHYCDAVYTVRRIGLEGHEHYGRWAVCRTSIQNGYIHDTCIKVFTDEDDEFNQREAEELVAKIKER